ncbi:MAG TPA: efflux RND transporter periplasmic adaptor subunit, partial [Burkholderiaceae bacterium]|nr:efflux RND transporter periplasmic adaptor subunit [Burkholderiaceae bacterium]
MKSKLIVIVFALAGLGGLGWFAYTTQRNPSGTGFEVKAGAPQAGAPAPQAAGGPGAAPGGAAGGSGGPAGAQQGGGQQGGQQGGGPRGPVGVEIAKVETRALAEEAAAVGSLRANESVTLRAEVAGRIERVGFTDGARVKRGTVLIALDASVTAAELEQSRAELALARANYDRTAELAQRNFVSASARDQSAANLKVQEARVKLAEARLAKSEIRAPFDGVMGLRNVSPGDFVRDGADLAVIEDIARMKVDLRLPERYFGRVRAGQAVQVSFDSLPGRTFTATLTALDAQIDANGRALLARGTLANPDGGLRSGMFARARVILRENPSALVVPEEALIAQGAEVFVWKVVDGKAQRTRIETGLRRDGIVEVTAGLALGDTIVTAGQLRLQRDGQEVRPVDGGRRPGGPGNGTGPGPGSVSGPRDGGPQAAGPAASAPGGAPAPAGAAPAAP